MKDQHSSSVPARKMNLHNHKFSFGLCFLSKLKCILCFDKIEKKTKKTCIWGKKNKHPCPQTAQALSSRNKASLWKQVNLVFAQHFLGTVRRSPLCPQVLPANPPRVQPAPWRMWQTGFMSPARWINDLSKRLACSRDLIFFFFLCNSFNQSSSRTQRKLSFTGEPPY